MAETIKLPGVGPVKKGYVWGGAAAVGLVAAVALYRRHQSASSASTASTATPDTSVTEPSDPYPADGTVGDPSDPYSTDPETGETYGDEGSGLLGADLGDQALEDDTGDGGGTVTTGTTGTTGTTPPVYTTNAQWVAAAEQLLGGDANSVGNALGKYVLGSQVTADQQTIIESAIAATGTFPPVSGANGMPPGINLVSGSTPPAGQAVNPVAGLKVTDTGYTSITVAWKASKGATSYLITTTPGGQQQKVTGTSVRIGSLKRKTAYDIKVRAQPGGTGGTDAHASATTK